MTHTVLRDELIQRGYAGPVRLLSEDDRQVVLQALGSGQEPPPLDWNKGRAATSRLLYEIAVRPGILDVVASRLGRDVILWGATLVRRSAGAIHPWHTDIESLSPEGGTVSVWIGLEHTTPQSSLRVVPRSHGFGVSVQEMAHRDRKTRNEITDADVERWARAHHPESGLETLELYDGDAVFFDGRLWHGSHNVDPVQTRLALLLQYAVPSTPIRMPDLKQLEWPVRTLESPLPPCLLVRGDSNGGVNRIVPAPIRAEPGVRSRLDSRIARPPLPIEPDAESGWKPHGLFRGQTPDLTDMSCHVSILACGRIPHPPHTHPEEEILIVLTGEADVILPSLAGTVGGERRRLRRGDFVYYPAHFQHTLQALSAEGTHYLMFKWLSPPSTEGPPLPFGHYAALGRINKSGQGGFRTERLFEGATAWLRKLHCHVSTLDPGAGYAPHSDGYDVAMIVLEGEVESLGERIGPNSVIFYAAGEPHGIRNPGTSAARYLVFSFHGSQNAFALRRPRAWREPGLERTPALSAFHRSLGQMVRLALPETARLLVISKGDEDLLACTGRPAAHFPQSADGTYLGHHPADSHEAIRRLEALREKGAEYLLIPEPSLWWLEFYAEFRRHLDTHCPMVAFVEKIGVIFALRQPVFRPRIPLA